MIRYHLGIGSNMGNRGANLSRCRHLLLEAGISILSSSAIYETEPVGLKDQPWFLNQALEVATERFPLQVLETIKGIEKRMGRIPTPLNGPRLIDIDILLAGDLVMDSQSLQIPHPRLMERNFVLVPLAEIAPGVIHPLQQRTILDLKEKCSDSSRVRLNFRPGSQSVD